MRNTVALLVPLALSGCYAQIEDSSVSITRPICDPATPNCIPGGGVPLNFIQASGRNTLKVPLGNQDFIKPQLAVGPTKLTSHLVLNQAVVDMKTAGADFKGITQATIFSAPRESTGTNDDPCAASTVCPMLASYDQATGGVADQQLVMKGTGTDLIPLIDQVNHQLIIEVRAKGNGPGGPAILQWGANITFDMGLSARVNYP